MEGKGIRNRKYQGSSGSGEKSREGGRGCCWRERKEKRGEVHAKCGEFLPSCNTRIARRRGGGEERDEVGARPNFGDLLILAPRPPSVACLSVFVRRVGTFEIAHTHACPRTRMHVAFEIFDPDVKGTICVGTDIDPRWRKRCPSF